MTAVAIQETPTTLTDVWTINQDHTQVEFSVKHMMFTTVKGRFGAFSGTISFDPSHPEAGSVNVAIETASVDTRSGQRDEHLRSGDFFDAERFPTMTFVSKRIEPRGDDLRVVGDLTIRGVTREVVLNAEYQGQGIDPYGQQVLGFSAQTEIERKDYGLTWNSAIEGGGVLVSDHVKISLDVQATR